MNASFLYSIPQLIIFTGIAAIVYGWVEQKRPFRIIGTSILIILGLYAIYVLLSGYLAGHKYFTPYEAVMGELDEQEMLSEDELLLYDVPFQVKLFPAYISFLISAVLAVPALVFELMENKKQFHIFIILAILVCLFGFFIIVRTLQMI